MKWTELAEAKLIELCVMEVSNKQIAEHFNVAVKEIYTKRSQMGITIPKIKVMQEEHEAEAKADEEKVEDRDIKAVKELIKNAYGHLNYCIECLGTLSGILEDLKNE